MPDSCATAAAKLEAALQAALGTRIPVTVVSVNRLQAALLASPALPKTDRSVQFVFLFRSVHHDANAVAALAALSTRAAPDLVQLLESGDAILMRTVSEHGHVDGGILQRTVGCETTMRSRGTVLALAAVCDKLVRSMPVSVADRHALGVGAAIPPPKRPRHKK